MPIYSVKAPDGKIYDVQGPEGATVDQLAQFIQQSAPAADTPASAPPQDQPSIGAQIGRQIGLTGRAAVNGLTALPNMLWNGPAGAINALAGTHIPLASGNAIADAVGLPKPQGGMENVAQDVSSAMASVSPFGLLGKIGEAAGPVTKGTLGLLGDRIGSQVASAGLASGAASGMREGGAAPVDQIGAGLLAGALPMTLGYTIPQIIKGVARGGEAGRQTMLDTTQTFNASGTSPTLGQATQGAIPRAIESLLSKTPGGAGIMANKAQNQASEIQNRVGSIVDDLSGNAGAVQAGESVAQGLQGFKQGFKGIQKDLYDNLDQFIPLGTPIQTTRTQAALHDLNQSIAGAENVSKMFQNDKIAGILGNFEKDLTNSAQQPVPTGMGGIMSAPPSLPLTQATMPYEAIKKLRTLVGQELDNTNFTSDVPRSKWNALYAALSNDLGDAATKAGPEAQRAWNWANAFTHTQSGRLEQMNNIIGKDSPEKIFNAAMSGTNEGDTILKRVVSAIPKDNRRDLAATVIARMGRATPGNQNDVGEIFSPNTFLTNWNGMSPAARQTLFGRVDRPGLLGDLGDVASVASNLRDGSKVFSNPSGTSGAVAGLGMFNSAVVSALMGHPILAAASLAPIPAARWLANKVTDPQFVQSISRRGVLSPGYGLGLLAADPTITQGILAQ